MSNGTSEKCKDAELNGRITPADMYKEGSASLRNYSNLTMSVRTLAMHLFLGSAVALAVASSKELDELPKYVFYGAGCLGLFSVSLLCINWHFATAFNVIRNSMVKLEDEAGVKDDGPWNGHKRVRGGWKDPIAYTAPFTALFLLATAGAVAGLHGMGWVRWSLWADILVIGVLTAFVAGLGVWATWDKDWKTG